MPDPTIPAGWPCALLAAGPPSVADRQSNATADDLLPQVLALTPRGAAWGRDEAGDGQGAGPVMRQFWRAIATWVADINARDHAVASQCFPSAATIALADWETELGLPGLCGPPPATVEARVALVRARFGALGGCSPAYFTCLAASLGHAVTIEEPTQFLCDVSDCVADGITYQYFTCDESECDGDPVEGFTLPAPGTIVEGDEVAGGAIHDTDFACDESECGSDGDAIEGFDPYDPNANVWKYWVVKVTDPSLSYFSCDDSECGADGDPLEGYTPDLTLECEMRRLSSAHTALVFDYVPAA